MAENVTAVVIIDKALILPDKIRGEIMAVLNVVKIQEIENDSAFEASGIVLDTLSTVGKKVESHFDKEIKDRHSAHKKATAARADYTKPLREAIVIWRKKIGEYQFLAEEKARIEQEKVDAGAAKQAETDKVNLAAELEKKGDIAQATAIIEDKTEPVIVAPKVEAPRAMGVSVGKVWRGELEDIKKFVVAIAAGNAPISLLALDSKKENIPIFSNINKFAVATGGSIKVAGVRFYQANKVGRGGKRS